MWAGVAKGAAMKKLITIWICCVASLLVAGVAEAGGKKYYGRGYHGGGYHGGGWRGGVWIGAPIVIGAPYYYPPYYYPYYPSYPYPYRYGPPVVREYIYEQPAQRQAPTVVAPQTPTWYYCRESKAYYPYVNECPGGWDSVPAKPPAGGQP